MIYLLRKKKEIQTYQKSNYHLNLIYPGQQELQSNVCDNGNESFTWVWRNCLNSARLGDFHFSSV